MVTKDRATIAETVSLAVADASVVGMPYVGTAGDLKVDMYEGGTVTFVGVSGFLPIIVKKIYKVGTDAADILVLK